MDSKQQDKYKSTDKLSTFMDFRNMKIQGHQEGEEEEFMEEELPRPRESKYLKKKEHQDMVVESVQGTPRSQIDLPHYRDSPQVNGKNTTYQVNFSAGGGSPQRQPSGHSINQVNEESDEEEDFDDPDGERERKNPKVSVESGQVCFILIWGMNKLADILRMTFSNTFSWKNSC